MTEPDREDDAKRRGRTMTLFSVALNVPVIAWAVWANLPTAEGAAVAAVMVALNGWLVYLRRRERA